MTGLRIHARMQAWQGEVHQIQLIFVSCLLMHLSWCAWTGICRAFIVMRLLAASSTVSRMHWSSLSPRTATREPAIVKQPVRARPHETRISCGMAYCPAYCQVVPCITGLCKTNARAIAICLRICSGIGPRIDRKCSGIAHCCTIICHWQMPDNRVYSARYRRNAWVFVDRYCRFTERFTLVLLWLLETLCYSMGNRKYASKNAMKYAMPRYIQ